MRPRKLDTASPLIEAYGSTQLAVSLGTTLSAVMDQPMMGGLIKSGLEIGAAQHGGFTDDQREQFRIETAERQREIDSITWDLNHNITDQVEREKSFARLDELQSKTEAQRSAMMQESIDAGRIMSPDAFSEKYGDLLEYTGPITPEAADLMYEGKKQEIIRNAIIQSGPKGIVATTAKIGASLLNTVTDPAELATMFIPVVGPARKAALVARFGKVGGAAATGAIEGGIGSLMTEPFYYALSRDQQLDYSMEDALFNVGAGVLLGGGIGTIVGALSRKSVDVRAIADAAGFDPKAVGIADDVMPAERMQPENIFQSEARAREVAPRMVAALDGPKTMREAISQLATDRGVQVDLVMPRTVARPQSLSEFIRAKGGINDADPMFRGELENLGIKGRAQYYKSSGTRVNGISNPNSKNNLDDIAELAHEAGFIPERDTNMLIDALREEQAGNFSFSFRDSQAAEDWRIHNQAKNDYEAELAHRDAIRTQLREIGYPDATDDEIALISEYMASGRTDLEGAAERVAIQASDLMAREEAMRASRIDLDPFADFEASQRAAMSQGDLDIEAAYQREALVVQQMNEVGALTDYQRSLLNEIDEIDAKTDAYIRNIQAAISCIVRN